MLTRFNKKEKKKINPKSETLNSKQIQMSKTQISKPASLGFRILNLEFV
jgi:hypothetical protein